MIKRPWNEHMFIWARPTPQSPTDSPITMTIVSWLLLFIHYLVLSTITEEEKYPVLTTTITELPGENWAILILIILAFPAGILHCHCSTTMDDIWLRGHSHSGLTSGALRLCRKKSPESGQSSTNSNYVASWYSKRTVVSCMEQSDALKACELVKSPTTSYLDMVEDSICSTSRLEESIRKTLDTGTDINISTISKVLFKANIST